MRLSMRLDAGHAGLILLAAIGHLLLTFWALHLEAGPDHMALLWLPDGWLLAWLVLLPAQRRPWLIALVASLTLLLGPMVTGKPLSLVASVLAADLFTAWGGAMVVERLCGGRAGFQSFRQPILFLLLAVLLLPAGAATLGAAAVVGHGLADDFAAVYRTWVSSSALGVLLVAPMVLYAARWLRERRWRMPKRRLAEHLLILLLIGLIAAEPMLLPVEALTFFSLPLLVWAALRFGVSGAISASGLLVLISVSLAAAGQGPFMTDAGSAAEAVLRLQAYLGSAVIASLFTGLAIEQPAAAHRETREQARRRRMLFDHAPVSLWEEDFSAVKAYLDALAAGGIDDIPAWLNAHPEGVRQCIARVRVLALNARSAALYEARSEAELMRGLQRVVDNSQLDIFARQIAALHGGATHFRGEARQRTLTGRHIDVMVNLIITPGHDAHWDHVLVAIEDLSERRRAEQSLRDALVEQERRHAAERLVSETAAELQAVSVPAKDAAINALLKRLARHLDADRCYLFQFSPDRRTISNSHEWCAAGIRAEREATQDLPVSHTPWWWSQMEEPSVLAIDDGQPPEAALEQRLFQAQQIRSLIAAPLFRRGHSFGFIGCDAVRRQRRWSSAELGALRLIADLLAGTLGRWQAEDDLRASESVYRAVVEDAPVLICRFLPGDKSSSSTAPTARASAKPPTRLSATAFWS